MSDSLHFEEVTVASLEMDLKGLVRNIVCQPKEMTFQIVARSPAKVNADGSLDLYFGPKVPAGEEHN